MDDVTIDEIRAMSDDEINATMPDDLAVTVNRLAKVALRDGETLATWKRRIIENRWAARR